MSRFLRWWGSELASCVPSWLEAKPAPFRGIVLTVGHDGPRLIHVDRRGISDLAQGPDQPRGADGLGARMAELAARRPRPRIAVRLPRDWVYARRVALPATAQREAARILALDLEQATPFRHRDVLLAHRVLAGGESPATAGTIIVEQLVCKRSSVDAAVATLTSHGLAPDRVDCWAEHGPGRSSALDVDFLGQVGLDAPRPRSRLVPLLVLSATALAVAAALLAVTRLEAAVADLESRTASLRLQYQSAEAANRAVATRAGQRTALVELKASEASRAVVIEAITRLLPDTDHLTSFRIEGRTIEIAGYAASAAALVPQIERSDMFERVALTAPVTLDERSGKQRFGIRFEVTGTGLGAAAAQPPQGG